MSLKFSDDSCEKNISFDLAAGHHSTAAMVHRLTTKSHTLPSSPTHSFSSSASASSSDFEFTISLSPRKSSAADLCPADELFYKGQLLPLHLSPRLSMVRTLLLLSSSSSSSDTNTTASRDSTASTDSSSADLLLHHHHLDCDSARPSSANDEELKRLTHNANMQRKPSKYFSLPKLSSVFRKDQKSGTAVKRASSSAREVIRKYFKKVKPLYGKLSQKPPQQQKTSPPPRPTTYSKISRSTNTNNKIQEDIDTAITHSFSGNLRLYNRGRSCFSSCPSSMGSSPSHGRSGFGYGHRHTQTGIPGSGIYGSDSSSMEELQNAIQGAILHCKNSMLQSKNLVSNEI